MPLQSANGTNSDADRTAIQQEVSSLCAEIDRISKDTTYGGQNIFERAASDRTISFQVGADANQTISMNLAAKFQKPKDGGGTEEVTAGKWSVKELAAAMGISDGIANCSATDFSGSDGKAFDVSTQGGAQKVLENIDKFIAAVDSKRAEFGAVQNRLESTIRNQSNVAENVEAARSRIRDTDFAEETSNMIQQNIIQQAAQAMLSQANQRSQMILSLLGG